MNSIDLIKLLNDIIPTQEIKTSNSPSLYVFKTTRGEEKLQMKDMWYNKTDILEVITKAQKLRDLIKSELYEKRQDSLSLLPKK